MVRSQPSRARTLQTLTGPHPRPGHRTRAAWQGKPRPRPAAGTHTCCRGWGFARLCSGAGRGSRSRGSPLRPPAPSRPRGFLRSSAHRARGRARGPAPAAGPGPRLRPRLLFRRARPGSCGAAARLSRKPAPSAGPAGSGNRAGGGGWGRGARLGPNGARRFRGVGEGVAGKCRVWGLRVRVWNQEGVVERRSEVKGLGSNK